MELRSLSGAILSLFLIFISACSSNSDPQSSSEQNLQPYTWEREEGNESEDLECPAGGVSPSVGIVGGEQVLKDSWIAKGTVFIVQEFSDFGNRKTSICTGSLIDANIVITAAHCVDRSEFNYQSNLSVYFTHQPECESANHSLNKKRRSVTAVRIHPLWDPMSSQTTNRGDLALVRISEKAPKGYSPLKLSSQFIPVPSGFPILITGYGMVNPDYYGEFGGPISLRVGTAPPISEEERAYLKQLTGAIDGTAGAYQFDNLSANEMLYIDQSKGQGICGGDSGGPSIVKDANGRFVVTGVASFVMNPRDSNLLCAYVAAHTSVVYHKAWIESAFREIRNENSVLETLFY